MNFFDSNSATKQSEIAQEIKLYTIIDRMKILIALTEANYNTSRAMQIYAKDYSGILPRRWVFAAIYSLMVQDLLNGDLEKKFDSVSHVLCELPCSEISKR